MHAFGCFVLSDRVDHVATSVASVQAAAVGGSRQSRATGRGGKDEARAEREPGRPGRASASWDFHLSVDRSHDHMMCVRICAYLGSQRTASHFYRYSL